VQLQIGRASGGSASSRINLALNSSTTSVGTKFRFDGKTR
jgi:hypothetical protein